MPARNPCSRRQVLGRLGGLGAALWLPGSALPVLWPRHAGATTARAVTLPELVGLSRHALAGTPGESWSRWETAGKSRRIVTYHRLSVTQSLDGRPPAESSVLVRTLGGRVGDIGQLVHGEAQLVPGEPTVLFLTEDADGVLGVTAMAQGHYPLTRVARELPRLQASPSMPALTRVDGCAVQRLVNKTVLEAEELISRHLPSP